MLTSACLDDAALVALGAGDAAAGARAAALRHADGCDSCRELLAALASAPRHAPDGAAPVERIGRYQLRHELGAGAMGTVYLAFDPELAREVALKLVSARAHADDEASRRDAASRLRARLTEARAMAQIDHPAVVRVYDAGVAGDELYVAMERLPGPTLAGWLAEARRTEAEVVTALAALGDGLAAAHAAGVVHRDFKPSNAMRDAAGGWKVTDFGLAATPDDEPAGLAGTPAYMAPEQRRGEAVDPRADQYAWAVTLHEALTGSRPAAGDHATTAPTLPARLARVIATAGAAASGDRFVDMAAAVAALRAAHVRPRRQRRALLGATAVGVTLALGGVAIGAAARTPPANPCGGGPTLLARAWPADAALRARTGDVSARTARALDAYASTWLDGHVAACRATAVERTQSPAVLEARMQCLEQRLAELGEVAALAGAATTPADATRGLSSALALTPAATCEASPSLRSRVPAPTDPASVQVLAAITTDLGRARAIQRDGRHADAAALLTAQLPAATRLAHAPTLAELELTLAGSEESLGQFDAATARYRAAAHHGAEGRDDALEATAWLGAAYVVGFRQQRPGEADAWLAAAEAAAARAGQPSRLAGQLAMTRGTLAMMSGDYDRARQAYRDGVSALEASLPVGDLRLAPALTNLGIAEQSAGDFAGAAAALARATSLRQAHLGDDHPDVGSALLAEGQLLVERGEPTAARPLVERALAIRIAALGADHVDVAPVQSTLGSILRQLGALDAARTAQRRALEIWERVYGGDHPNVTLALGNLAGVELDAGRFAEAETLYRRVVAARRRGAPRPSLATALVNLGEVRRLRGDRRAARELFTEGLALRTQLQGPDHVDLAYALVGLGEVALADGDRAAARGHFERALALREAAGVVGELAAQARFGLARALPPAELVRARALVAQAASLIAGGDPLADELAAWRAAHPEAVR